MHFVFKFLVFVALVVGVNQMAFSQNQSHLLDLRDCDKSCSSNNYSINRVFLSDQHGTPITTDLLSCEAGAEQTVYITLEYTTNSNSPAHNGRIFADLLVGEEEQFLNYYFGTILAAKDSPRKMTLSQFPMSWVCGEVVLLNNPTIAWTTSGGSDLSESYVCGSYPSAQCQFQSTIVVDAPLAVQFDHEAACLDKGASTVSFTSTTNGGRESYSYLWEFTNANLTTALVDHPVVEFLGTGTAKLTVTDANGTVSSYEQIIEIPSDYSITALVTEQTEEEDPDGTITLSLDLPDAYIYSWTGPDGFTSDQKDLTGLEAGIYEVWVTDKFGCSQWKEVEVLLAAALPVKWGDFSAISTAGKGVSIQWTTQKEVQTSHFEVERSLTPLEGFEKIGSVEGKGWSNEVMTYTYLDQELPEIKGEGWIYYRIKEVSLVGELMYSDLIRVQFERTLRSQSKRWRLFPNPFEYNQLWLQSMDGGKANESLHLTIVSPNQFIQTEVKLEQGKAAVAEIFQGLSKGLYILKVCGGEECEQVKLIKK